MTAAAQVGIAVTVRILQLDARFDDVDAWSAQIALLAWFTLAAVMLGTVVSSRNAGLGTRFSAAIAAALGGALGSAVALVPARHADVPLGDPLLLAGIAIGLAAAAGTLLAFVSAHGRALAWNAIVYGIVVWALLGEATTGPDPARLGQLSEARLSGPLVHNLGLWGPPAAAGVLALVVAVLARVRGQHRLPIALSGLAGPAMVAIAYLVAGPGSSDYQKIPWVAAMLAAGVGLAVSVVVGLPPRRDDAVAEAMSTDTAPLPQRQPGPVADGFAPRPASRRPDSTESWLNDLSPRRTPEDKQQFVPRPLG